MDEKFRLAPNATHYLWNPIDGTRHWFIYLRMVVIVVLDFHQHGDIRA